MLTKLPILCCTNFSGSVISSFEKDNLSRVPPIINTASSPKISSSAAMGIYVSSILVSVSL